jgi:uncharacterized membrane protein
MTDIKSKVVPAPPARRPHHPVQPAGPQFRLAGLCGAVLSLCLSLTPSLLPRTWLQQGVISGVSAAIGYGLGVLAGWLAGRLVRVGPRAERVAWRTAALLAPPLVGVCLYQGTMWQREIDRLMGQRPEPWYAGAGVLIVSLGLFGALLAAARSLGATVRTVAGQLDRWIPPAASRFTAVVVVWLSVTGFLNGVAYRGLLSIATDTAATADEGTGDGVSAPTSPARSGSPQSLVNWSALGRQGRAFVAGGPTVEKLTRFNGSPAKEPIRSYAGLDSAPTIAETAALAVRELRRAGGFSRKILCVITTTGTGWVDPKAASALEYMYNGDTALVGIQYSYLPSWISFLVEADRAREAGRELFNQAYAEWSTLPPGQRPKLLVFAESLGALGSEAAFRGVDDIHERTDGVLWVGPTNANNLWGRLAAERDPGTREILPTYRQGRTVRFAAEPSDLGRPAAPSDRPRIVYLQHASDPVVWWSPKLLLHRPDWLEERRGDDVLPAIRWYPFVTFLQVTADLQSAYDAPAAHGHRYGRSIVAAWAAIAPPPGWTAERTRQLTELIAPRG